MKKWRGQAPPEKFGGAWAHAALPVLPPLRTVINDHSKLFGRTLACIYTIKS